MREAVVDKGYSTELHELDWRHPYIFLIDIDTECRDNPLCRIILEKGKLEKIEKPVVSSREQKHYQHLLEIVRSKGFERVLRNIIEKYLISGAKETGIFQATQ